MNMMMASGKGGCSSTPMLPTGHAAVSVTAGGDVIEDAAGNKIDTQTGWIDFKTNRDKKPKVEQKEGWIDFSKQTYDTHSETKASDLLTIVGISVSSESALVQQGYPTDVAAIAYDKNLDIFSDSHHILQMFFEPAVKDVVQFEHDPECTMFPEVYSAWKSAGQEDNCPMVATC